MIITVFVVLIARRRRCGLPLFGRSIPITSEATLRVYRQRLEEYALDDREMVGGWVVDERRPGESFCSDCPDHEGCMTGYPCGLVKHQNDRFRVGGSRV